MKKIFTTIAAIALSICVFAQSPQKMSYQCIIRNTSGVLVTNQSVGIRISILQGTTTGTVVYQETYNPNPQTNANGLLTIEIGSGLAVTGTFSVIDWASGPYFLKTETDPTGGTNYTIIGTNQLLSVPYALHAKSTAEFNYNNLKNKPDFSNWDKDSTDNVTLTGDQTIAGNKMFTGTINASSKIILNVASPLSATDAANKAYVDALMDKVMQLQAGSGAKDIEGNTYKAVKIGNQLWMAENLKTTKYNDGTAIPGVTDNAAWSNLTTPGYCWLNNDNANKNVYGAIYNWYTVNTGNLCPIGWHVSSYDEWITLITYVGGHDVAGRKLKATSGWENNGNGTDDYGFAALPGDGRNGSNGEFRGAGLGCGFWSSTRDTHGELRASIMHWSVGHLELAVTQEIEGYSVRCLMDGLTLLPSVITNAVSDITSSTATSGGNVTNDGGAPVIARGVCWSINPNPTTANSKTIDGNGTGNFTSRLTILVANTTFYMRAYATNNVGTNYGDQVSFITDKSDIKDIIFNPNLTYGTVVDVDGNTYKTIQIGTQTWMAENLKTTKYSDGTALPLVTDSIEWKSQLGPVYCWYNNDEASYKSIYGALYNWYAVAHLNLCPTGWHVPDDYAWDTLLLNLDANASYGFGAVIVSAIAGGKLKEAGMAHWNNPNIGATNETGFTALPGGSRSGSGGYNGIGKFGTWRSFSPSRRSINYNATNVFGSEGASFDGFSVRCVKNK